ncbi:MULTISPECIES: vWA domain-containing protein [Mycolicibacterium]|uniref:vWA domain-containing protein n=1 Tax=Mycolicibacterium TaxID=1866885 RepID=UPI002636D031|nr:vWA domain-containing protein [Mycolicibacterium fortuitum]
MNFAPVLPVYLLAVIAVAVVAVRVVSLYRLLTRAAPGRYRPVVLRWLGLTFATLLLVLAAFRPGIPDAGGHKASAAGAVTSDLNIFFVVDRSVTTRIEDFGVREPRMQGIRTDIAALMEKYPSARFSMVSFSTKPKVSWPLSQEFDGLDAYVKGLSAYGLTPANAVYYINPTVANDALKQRLEAAKTAYPESKNVVFYLGDGYRGQEVPKGTFNVPEDLISGGAVLGYGTPEGGPIPAAYEAGQKAYLGDPNGAPGAWLNAAINETELNEIAKSLGVKYFHRAAGEDITPVLPPVRSGGLNDAGEGAKLDPLVGRSEWYWAFALISAVLLLIEGALMVREYRRSRLSRSDITAEDVV